MEATLKQISHTATWKRGICKGHCCSTRTVKIAAFLNRWSDSVSLFLVDGCNEPC